jgi:peptidoglycan hydrolase-like protein with peptidoglycan-binding domain
LNNLELQQHLNRIHLLHPPVDGKVGGQTIAALEDFQKLKGLPVTGNLDDRTSDALAQTSGVIKLSLQEDLASAIVRYHLDRKLWIPFGDRRYTIFYSEGMNRDGSLNNDAPDEWNDRRFVLEVPNSGVPRLVHNGLATTEPGKFWTASSERHRLGAARIQLDKQFWAWQVGYHRGKSNHPALVQTGGAVIVCRDANQDYSRAGDKTYEGLYGINQHHGYDMAKVGKASAGCLVEQSIESHFTFMKSCKSDRRYKINHGFIFCTTVTLGSTLRRYLNPAIIYSY